MPMARHCFKRQWEQCFRDMTSIRQDPPYTHRYLKKILNSKYGGYGGIIEKYILAYSGC